jgi:predicted transcriptional regulator YheO
MTCRGYDVKAVKVGKPVKTLAATILDNHQRRAFIKSYARVEESNARMRSSRGRSDKSE